jgi:hypothetical protein
VNNFGFNLFPQIGNVARKYSPTMNVITDAEDVLKEIETAVVRVSRGKADMTNYAALRAYEAAITHYHAIARQQQPKPANLSGSDALVDEAIQIVCEARLGRPIPRTQTLPSSRSKIWLPACVV